MIMLPDEIMKIVNNPKSSKTIATESNEGRIHTIYMGSMTALSPEMLAFAHILMKRTHQNLRGMKGRGDLVSVSVTLEQVSYEIMAKVGEYQTSGPVYDMMIDVLTRQGVKEGLDKYGLEVLGVWTLEPMEVWNQSPGPGAGTRVL
jgi:uncharacterized protein